LRTSFDYIMPSWKELIIDASDVTGIEILATMQGIFT
jgi:hypothetical protein